MGTDDVSSSFSEENVLLTYPDPCYVHVAWKGLATPSAPQDTQENVVALIV